MPSTVMAAATPSATTRTPGRRSRPGLLPSTSVGHVDVEVMHVLAHAHGRVECHGRRIHRVRLHEDHIRAPVAREGLERLDQTPRDAAPTVRLRHREVIDVDLATLAFELLQ